MKLEWKDITGYSQGDKKREPHWWCLDIPQLRITIGNKHINYPDSNKRWFMNCEPWFRLYILDAKNLEDAKKEAVLEVKDKLEKLSRIMEKMT